MAPIWALKECHVRKDLAGSIENNQQILVTQVMQRDPLLKHAMLGEVRAAKLIKPFVIEVCLTADPQCSHLDGNHVVRFSRKEQKIAAVGNGKGHPRIAVE